MSELNNAPKHIQLAVDLIELLEQNEVDPQLALDALAIVCDDYRRKIEMRALKSKASHGDTEEKPREEKIKGLKD